MAEYCPYASNSQRDLDNCQNYVSTFPNINIMRLSLDFYWGAIRRKIFFPRKVYFLLFKGFQISKVILIAMDERSGRHMFSFLCLYPCFIWWVTAECVVLWWGAVPRYQQCLAWLSRPRPDTLSLISLLLTFLLAISQSTESSLTKYWGVNYEHPVLKAAWKLGIFTCFTSKNNLAKSEWKCKNQSFIWKFTL